MPSKSSRFVHSQGFVCFFNGNIWGKRGSRISHSSSVRLLEYAIVFGYVFCDTLIHRLKRCQMGSIDQKMVIAQLGLKREPLVERAF